MDFVKIDIGQLLDIYSIFASKHTQHIEAGLKEEKIDQRDIS